MTCHIVNKKANDLCKMCSFAITVNVAVCGFLRVCALSALFAVCALFALSISASASASASASVSVFAFAVPESSTPSASFMTRLLSVPCLLYLHLLCLC